MSDPVQINKVQISAEMLKAIIDLQADLKARAPEAKSLRKVPEASVQALQDIGFFRALQPAAYGGYELDPQDFFKLHLAIAEGCMSTAWACGIVAVHAFQIALMDKQAQEDVWGKDIHTRVSSSYAPMGKVERVEGGFKFSGRWGWSSGSDHCTWALLGGIVAGEGYRTFLVPKSDYKIIDTWHSMGLQGTGSNDIVVESAFVPDYRTHKQLDGFHLTNPGIDSHSPYLFSLPWAQIFVRVVSTPAIGACKNALSLYKEIVSKKLSMDASKHASDPQTLEKITSAQNIINEMETVMMHNFDEMLSCVKQNQAISIEKRALYRYQASIVIDKSIALIDSLFSMAGGSSIFIGSDIQQRFLDIHTARAHVANNPTTFARNYGAIQLGLENADFFI